MSARQAASAGSTGVTLRAVTEQDRQLLLDIYASTREDELALTGWDAEERAAFVEMQFAAQKQDYETRFPGSNHDLVLVDGKGVGRMWVSKTKDEIRLLDIALLANSRCQGIGTFLLRQLQQDAVASATPLRHSVYKMNERALRFYLRLGFQVVKDFETYVLMEWLPETLTRDA